jgi:hypothetical protein
MEYESSMSYNLTIYCGCTVYVACDPRTNVAHTRIIERRGPLCRIRTHDVGARLFLWDILPEPQDPGDTALSDQELMLNDPVAALCPTKRNPTAR